MEYLTTARNLLPSTWPGIVLATGTISFLSLYILSYPYSWARWHRTNKYKYSVCWEHYKLLEYSLLKHDEYSLRELVRRRAQYEECLHSARKSQSIFPAIV